MYTFICSDSSEQYLKFWLQFPIFLNYAACKSHGKKIMYFTVRVEGTGSHFSLKWFVVVVVVVVVVVAAAAAVQDADADHTLFVVLNTKLSITNTVGRAVIIIELLGHQKLRIWNYPFCASYLTCYIQGMPQLFYSNIRTTTR